jgi:nitroreductase
MDILKEIKGRRSIRRFKRKAISAKTIWQILEAGRWAPSGLNNQPWRFMVLSLEKKNQLAQHTKYSHIIEASDKCILIFLDKQAMYNQEKDIMAIGACIQNMLLYINQIGLGACWLGEILNQRQDVYQQLKIPKNLELEAVIAIGYPDESGKKPTRKSLKQLTI